MIQEALRSLYGAYRLARRDAGGMAFFNTTIDGFWRSFLAAAIIAPFYILLLYIRFNAGEMNVHPYRFVAVEAISYVLSWVTFPVVMISLAKFLEREKNYLAYIVAYNWASVLQNALYLPLAMLMVNELLPAGMASALSLIVFLMIIFYTWFVARTALNVSGGIASGIVVLDLVISVFINATAESMF
ncbi:MAG: hypothetical protein A3G18_06850 [Rhodospirillales bacterium RIFCSPLOWO2_12_FULL_58_28]|nr:MAG: hypothetical protein A3H92_11415 [Rhodospirillales bacterium RIFCSPLOWO2_02_FULL_58_16]OHC77439.1 MAG: hypothetical protein A3G18_06850 [Rhodospirillales bacterium RIFCSPLOWO2_12_FULL_58_28]